MGEDNQSVARSHGNTRIGIAGDRLIAVANRDDNKLVGTAEREIGDRMTHEVRRRRDIELADLQADLLQVLVHRFVIATV